MDGRSRFGWLVPFVTLLGCTSSSSGSDADATSSTSSGTAASTSTSVAGSSGSSSTAAGSDDSTGAPAPPSVAPLVVMSFNVLCEICDSSYDPWLERLDYIADTIARHDPDLIGLQELMNADNVQQILDLNPGYTAVAFLDQGGIMDYPDATILVRTSRFEVVDHGFYWLSPTPDAPLSTGFADGFQLPRQVTWAELVDSDGQGLLFIDTHFDNNSPSQELSAPLVIERTMDPAAALPTIFVGDFNSTPSTEAYAILTGAGDPDAFALTDAFEIGPMWTQVSNLDPPVWNPDERIDHIFVGPRPWVVSDWWVDTHRYGPSENFTSDHFAIAAALELPPS